jgi:hypothetical protein
MKILVMTSASGTSMTIPLCWAYIRLSNRKCLSNVAVQHSISKCFFLYASMALFCACRLLTWIRTRVIHPIENVVYDECECNIERCHHLFHLCSSLDLLDKIERTLNDLFKPLRRCDSNSSTCCSAHKRQFL